MGGGMGNQRVTFGMSPYVLQPFDGDLNRL